MADRPTNDPEPVPGLVGGPGPAPPGVDDGTPKLAPEEPAAASAATRGEDADAKREPRSAREAAARGDPEEPDPS